MAQECVQLGDVGCGVFGVPLNADNGGVRRFNGLDGAVGRVGADAQGVAEVVHALVVCGRDGQLGIDQDGRQRALQVAVGLDAHAMPHEAVVGEDRGIRVRAVRDVLLEGATERGIDDLHAAADAQQRRAGAAGIVDEGELSLVCTVPVAALAIIALRASVVSRMNILTAHDDDGVGVACAQGGALGAVLLRVFANHVPGGHSCFKNTIPQAHADVVVCLVPRPRRQDVGNQQRRLRVVRHGPYHGRLRVRARGAFTKWRIVTACVHVVGTAKSARFSREINGQGRGRPRDHVSMPRPRSTKRTLRRARPSDPTRAGAGVPL